MCLYAISEQEIYILVFESGIYRAGYVDTYDNWMKAIQGARRS